MAVAGRGDCEDEHDSNASLTSRPGVQKHAHAQSYEPLSITGVVHVHFFPGANGLVPPIAFKKLFLLACLPTYLEAIGNHINARTKTALNVTQVSHGC